MIIGISCELESISVRNDEWWGKQKNHIGSRWSQSWELWHRWSVPYH